jgi:hypothetical protein
MPFHYQWIIEKFKESGLKHVVFSSGATWVCQTEEQMAW